MQPFIPLPHPHPQRSNKIIIQQQLFPQKEPPPQPLFPKKFMCISFIFLILCDFPLCHFYLFWRKAENMYVHLCFNFFSFASTSYYYTKQNLVTNCKKNLITFSKANNIDIFATTNFAYKYFGLYVKKVCFIELKVL